MPLRSTLATTFRPSEALREEIQDYARRHTHGNVSAAICELLEAGLKANAAATPRMTQRHHRDLRTALESLYPEWSGKAHPNFGRPVRVELKGNSDPMELILARRRR